MLEKQLYQVEVCQGNFKTLINMVLHQVTVCSVALWHTTLEPGLRKLKLVRIVCLV